MNKKEDPPSLGGTVTYIRARPLSLFAGLLFGDENIVPLDLNDLTVPVALAGGVLVVSVSRWCRLFASIAL